MALVFNNVPFYVKGIPKKKKVQEPKDTHNENVNDIKFRHFKFIFFDLTVISIVFVTILSFLLFPPAGLLLAIILLPCVLIIILSSRFVDSIYREITEMHERRRKLAGEQGEAEVAEHLRKLNNRFIVINRLEFSTGGDIDHIVVGPTGFFIIETKNLKGKVIIKDRNFQYVKTGSGGGVYPGEAPNPFIQVKRLRILLKEQLRMRAREERLDIPIPFIHEVVVFGSNTEVSDDGSYGVPVLFPEELPSHILSKGISLTDSAVNTLSYLLLRDLKKKKKHLPLKPEKNYLSYIR